MSATGSFATSPGTACVLNSSNPQPMMRGAAAGSNFAASPAQCGASGGRGAPNRVPDRNSATCLRSSSVRPAACGCMIAGRERRVNRFRPHELYERPRGRLRNLSFVTDRATVLVDRRTGRVLAIDGSRILGLHRARELLDAGLVLRSGCRISRRRADGRIEGRDASAPRPRRPPRAPGGGPSRSSSTIPGISELQRCGIDAEPQPRRRLDRPGTHARGVRRKRCRVSRRASCRTNDRLRT